MVDGPVITVEFCCPKCGELLEVVFRGEEQLNFAMCFDCNRLVYVSRPKTILVKEEAG